MMYSDAVLKKLGNNTKVFLPDENYESSRQEFIVADLEVLNFELVKT